MTFMVWVQLATVKNNEKKKNKLKMRKKINLKCMKLQKVFCFVFNCFTFFAQQKDFHDSFWDISFSLFCLIALFVIGKTKWFKRCKMNIWQHVNCSLILNRPENVMLFARPKYLKILFALSKITITSSLWLSAYQFNMLCHLCHNCFNPLSLLELCFPIDWRLLVDWDISNIG